MSPHQIFIRGCLSQLHRNHTGIQGILGADEEPVEEIDTPPAAVVPPPGSHAVFHWPEAVKNSCQPIQHPTKTHGTTCTACQPSWWEAG